MVVVFVHRAKYTSLRPLCLDSYARISRSRNHIVWLTFALLSTAGFFTIPTMLYGFGAVWIWLLLMHYKDPSKNPHLLIFLSGYSLFVGVLTIALYFPAIVVWGVDAIVANKYVKPINLPDFVDGLPSYLSDMWHYVHRDLNALFSIMLTVGMLVTMLHWRRGRYTIPPAFAALLFTVPVVLLQRVLPFPRVWILMLPLYYVTATAGIMDILERLRLPGFQKLAYSVMVIWVLILAALVLHNGTVLSSTETGSFRDAENVTEYLERNLQPGDRVVENGYASRALEFYFVRHGLSLNTLKEPDNVTTRIWVLVDHLDALPDVEVIAQYPNLDTVKEFNEIFLILLTREETGSSRQGKTEGNDPGAACSGLELPADRARGGSALDARGADSAESTLGGIDSGEVLHDGTCAS